MYICRDNVMRCRGGDSPARRCIGALKWHWPPNCRCEEAAGRRGALSAKREEVPLGCNLAVPDPSWESYRRNRNCLPEIATGAKRPRNDKLEGFSPQNMCRKHCHPPWRSLTAATGPVGGGCHLNDSLCESFVQHRERHAAPLQLSARSVALIIHCRSIFFYCCGSFFPT